MTESARHTDEQNHESYNELRHGHADFDFRAVEDPIGVCTDELRAIAASMNIKAPITQDTGRIVLAWAATQAIGPGRPLLETVGLWLGGSDNGADVAVRAAVFIREFAPTARNSLNAVQIGSVFGKKRKTISNLAMNMRACLFGLRQQGSK